MLLEDNVGKGREHLNLRGQSDHMHEITCYVTNILVMH